MQDQKAIPDFTEAPCEAQMLRFEAARVRHVAGKEVIDAPTKFHNLAQAKQFIAATPVSIDGNRPWIRDCTETNWRKQFLMIGGKDKNRGEAAAEQAA
jgi:hypothetical protein